MDQQPNRLATFILFLASLVLEAMLFRRAAAGLRRAAEPNDSGERTAGALRWFVRILLAPVEVVAHIMTFLGVSLAMIWLGITLVACLIYIVLACCQFLSHGSIPNPMLLIDFIANELM